jgi:hypothetical protein
MAPGGLTTADALAGEFEGMSTDAQPDTSPTLDASKIASGLERLITRSQIRGLT